MCDFTKKIAILPMVGSIDQYYPGIVRSDLRSGVERSILRKAGAWSGVYSRGLLAERSGVYSTKCRSGANFAPLRPFLQFLNIRNFLATIGGQKVRLKIFRPLRRPKSTPKFFGPLRRPKSTHQNFFFTAGAVGAERYSAPRLGAERSILRKKILPGARSGVYSSGRSAERSELRKNPERTIPVDF